MEESYDHVIRDEPGICTLDSEPDLRGSFLGEDLVVHEERHGFESPEHRDQLGRTFASKAPVVCDAGPAVVSGQQEAEMVVKRKACSSTGCIDGGSEGRLDRDDAEVGVLGGIYLIDLFDEDRERHMHQAHMIGDEANNSSVRFAEVD